MTVLTIIGSLIAVYIVYIAATNKSADFEATKFKGWIMLGAWTFFVTIISYSKTLITVWICDYNRDKGMFWVGMTTQFGGLAGAGLAYILVNHTSFFA